MEPSRKHIVLEHGAPWVLSRRLLAELDQITSTTVSARDVGREDLFLAEGSSLVHRHA